MTYTVAPSIGVRRHGNPSMSPVSMSATTEANMTSAQNGLTVLTAWRPSSPDLPTSAMSTQVPQAALERPTSQNRYKQNRGHCGQRIRRHNSCCLGRSGSGIPHPTEEAATKCQIQRALLQSARIKFARLTFQSHSRTYKSNSSSSSKPGRSTK